MKTRIILDIETNGLQGDVLTKISLLALKEVKKAKASLLSIKSEEIREVSQQKELPALKEVCLKKAENLEEDFGREEKIVRNGFIDDCIEILQSARRRKKA